MRLPPRPYRLAALAALPLAWGCAMLKERFPSHEDVFTPVPLSIGEPRLVDGDTAYVLRGAGYELVAPRRELLPETQEELERVSRQFVRMFEVEPPLVVVRLLDSLPRRDRAADSAAVPLGPRVIPVVIPRRPRGVRREDFARVVRPPVARPVARGWFAAYVDTRYAGDHGATARAAPGEAARGDTLRPPPPLPYRAGEDPRLPDWLESGVAWLLIGSSAQEYQLAQLAERLERRANEVMPLRELFAASRPDASRGDSARATRRLARGESGAPEDDVVDDPMMPAGPGMPRARGARRPSAEMEAAGRFAVQAYAVTQFLAEREGPAFIGRIVDRIIDGSSIGDVLQRDARTLPDDLDKLDAEWRRWLRDRGPGGTRGR